MSQSFHIAFNEALLIENHLISRITCITCWGKQLVVGTEKGHLLIYEFIPERTGFKPDIKGSHSEFSKKPIDQISVHESHNFMIMLSDGLITVHSLPSLNRIVVLKNFKGAISYSADNSSGNIRLAIIHKKKIYVTEWSGQDFILKKGTFRSRYSSYLSLEW